MATPISNLPISNKSNDSSDSAKKFFNTYYDKSIAVPGEVIDASVGYFISKGFSETAAQAVATVLISQAKIDNVNVFTLIDTLKKLNEIQLSTVVREILNNNRLRISTLGTKVDNSQNIQYELRNIIP
jgi:hypothetical protein